MHKKTAIVVVHGLGDPLPGDALRGLIEGLQAGDGKSNFRLDGSVTVRHIDAPLEPQADPDRVNGYPVTHVGLTDESVTPARRYECSEVYWGDLSRVRQSISALLYSLFDLIFGLRHIVEEATRWAPSGLGKWSGHIASASLWTARGPMFALNVQLAVTCLTLVAMLSLPDKLKPGAWAAQVAAMAASIIVVVVGAIAWGRVQKLEWSQATAGSMVVVGSLSAIYTAEFWSDSTRNLDPYVNVMTMVMTIGAIFMVLLGLLAIAFSAMAFICPAMRSLFSKDPTAARERAMPLLVIAFCTALSLCLFVFAVIACWTIIVKTIDPDPDVARFECLETPAVIQSLKGCVDGKLTALGLLAKRIHGGVHLLPAVISIFGVATLIYLIIGVLNWAIGEFSRDKKTPRLRYIVSPAVIAWFTVASFGGGVAFMIWAHRLLWLGACGPIKPEECLKIDAERWIGLPTMLVAALRFLPEWKWLNPAFVWINEFENGLKPAALSLTVALAAFVVASRAHFLTALDLVLDVISHFRTAPGPKALEDSERFTQWHAMVERFRRVVRDATVDPAVSRLVVISHSQGTMVALHGLGLLKLGEKWQLDRPTRESLPIDLVTMGSPLCWLYRHYLPQRYVLCMGDRLTESERWINIHRIDDFVGTDIKLTRAETSCIAQNMDSSSQADDLVAKTVLLNEDVGTGGHIDYWHDRRVLKKIICRLRSA